MIAVVVHSLVLLEVGVVQQIINDFAVHPQYVPVLTIEQEVLKLIEVIYFSTSL